MSRWCLNGGWQLLQVFMYHHGMKYDYLNFKENLIKENIYSKDFISLSLIRSNINLETIDSIINKNYFFAWFIAYSDDIWIKM